MASIKLVGLISLVAIAACEPSFAQQGTDAQREACTPDAFRLCTSAMPDSGRVEACLRSNGPRLSAACNAVFNPPEQSAQTSGQMRGRSPRDVQQRDSQQREYGQRYDQPREFQRERRDDGFGDYQQRDYQSRPQPRNNDD